MEKILLRWINFWQTRKKLFLFLLLLIIGFFSFSALQINLNSDINQIFPDKEIAKILISSESQKVFISTNTRNSNTNNNEALKEIRNELLLKFPNQLNLITNKKDQSSSL